MADGGAEALERPDDDEGSDAGSGKPMRVARGLGSGGFAPTRLRGGGTLRPDADVGRGIGIEGRSLARDGGGPGGRRLGTRTPDACRCDGGLGGRAPARELGGAGSARALLPSVRPRPRLSSSKTLRSARLSLMRGIAPSGEVLIRSTLDRAANAHPT
jgi:hypothetical protein